MTHDTIKTLAEHWGVSPETVRQRIVRRELAALRIGKLYRIPFSAVEAFEREHSTCTESDTSQDGDTSTSSGPRADELEPRLREATTLRLLNRFSPG